MTRGFEIKPWPADLGGGWRLFLFEDGEEVGGGVFPTEGPSEAAVDVAYQDALSFALEWTGL